MTPAQNKWQMALKSGQWRQGFKRLRDPSGGHCCLGVAIACGAVPDRQFTTDPDDDDFLDLNPGEMCDTYDGCLDHSVTLCSSQARTLSLADCAETQLALLNDHGVSHREIADCLIEFWLTGDPSGLEYLG